MFDFDYRDELESAVTYYRESMPERIRDLIGLASYDLHHGPIWLDADGEATSGYDDDAIAHFDFSAACAEIGDWMDSNVNPLSCEVSYDEETGESEYEAIGGSERDIIAKLCGKALADYI